jgi:hypothetical protein
VVKQDDVKIHRGVEVQLQALNLFIFVKRFNCKLSASSQKLSELSALRIGRLTSERRFSGIN